MQQLHLDTHTRTVGAQQENFLYLKQAIESSSLSSQSFRNPKAEVY
jgi:hypothetical protein